LAARLYGHGIVTRAGSLRLYRIIRADESGAGRDRHPDNSVTDDCGAIAGRRGNGRTTCHPNDRATGCPDHCATCRPKERATTASKRATTTTTPRRTIAAARGTTATPRGDATPRSLAATSGGATSTTPVTALPAWT
jgi:hypothetical protein